MIPWHNNNTVGVNEKIISDKEHGSRTKNKQMKFPKKTLFVIAVSVCVIIIGYIARVSLINSISKEQLALYQAKITCLDFHLTANLALSISHLCLETPQATININDMAINFQLAEAEKIKRIDIASVMINGKAELFSQLDTADKTPAKVSASEQLNTQLRQLTQLDLPFDIAVKKLYYLPFKLNINNQENQHKPTKKIAKDGYYSGYFFAKQNKLELALKDTQQQRFLAAKVSTNQQQERVDVELTIQLTPLIDFIFDHNLEQNIRLPSSVSALKKVIQANGEFHSLINYQDDKLTIKSQLNAFKLAANEGIKNSGPFQLTGELNIDGEVNFDTNNADSNPQIAIQFNANNKLQLQFSHPHLIGQLDENLLATELISLLNDNPVNQLIFRPNGTLSYQVNTQQLSLSGIEITAQNHATQVPASITAPPTHQLNINNIVLDLNNLLAVSNKRTSDNDSNINDDPSPKSPLKDKLLTELDFALDSALIVFPMKSFTSEAMAIKLQGSVRQSSTETLINIAENSFLSINNMALSTKQNSVDKKRLTIKNITSHLQGNIHLQDQQAMRLNVKIDSQANNLRAAKILDIKSLMLNSVIIGSLDNININTRLSADTVPLGNLAISGTVEKPNISLTASTLSLTDLLSLNIKLPAKVALVDGALSYSVEGQISDWAAIENTPLTISLAITSVSGEVEGIWLQELNWQQNFNYFAGKLSTRNNSEENLTVALIDTPTPIVKLSISTALSYQKDFKVSVTKLKGDILGGSFSIPKVQWPLEHGHSVNVQLTHIDLEQVLALDKKQGIVVTGNISGQLPISFDGEKYTMEKGKLHNVSNGLIQVLNNPAVNELKANNSQLKLAFDALQNLHYHQLSSDVSMADDGYMLLETVIKGRNPDLDNDVNLNLNLSYDLLGLLESLSITEQFEQRIIKGLQKNIKE